MDRDSPFHSGGITSSSTQTNGDTYHSQTIDGNHSTLTGASVGQKLAMGAQRVHERFLDNGTITAKSLEMILAYVILACGRSAASIMNHDPTPLELLKLRQVD